MRVLVVDDHAAIRRSLSLVLESEAGLAVVGEASDGASAVQLAKELQPDIVLMDVVMPHLDGADATRQILEQCPRVQVVGLSVHASKMYVIRMLRAGARAYVLKEDGIEELAQAMRAAREGRIYLSSGLDGFDG